MSEVRAGTVPEQSDVDGEVLRGRERRGQAAAPGHHVGGIEDVGPVVDPGVRKLLQQPLTALMDEGAAAGLPMVMKRRT